MTPWRIHNLQLTHSGHISRQRTKAFLSLFTRAVRSTKQDEYLYSEMSCKRKSLNIDETHSQHPEENQKKQNKTAKAKSAKDINTH